MEATFASAGNCALLSSMCSPRLKYNGLYSLCKVSRGLARCTTPDSVQIFRSVVVPWVLACSRFIKVLSPKHESNGNQVVCKSPEIKAADQCLWEYFQYTRTKSQVAWNHWTTQDHEYKPQRSLTISFTTSLISLTISILVKQLPTYYASQ